MKSYNPFKMWGSYVGGVIIAIFGFFPAMQLVGVILNCTVVGAGIIPVVSCYKDSVLLGAIQLILGVVLAFAIGFLIGWGINSIWRYYKK